MRTQLMLDQAAGMPWLERDSADGAPPERMPLAAFPVTLGRSDAVDLTLPSGRVSREHARIVCEGGKYLLRDLGSTNGTFVNGQRIDESPLEDGDLIALADIELTFYSGKSDPSDRMATQVMTATPAGQDGELAAELIREVRRMHEALASRAVQCRFVPVVRLDDGSTFGYEAAAEDTELTEAQRLLLSTECRLTLRLRRLRRMVAVEEATQFDPGAAVFLELDPSEIGSEGLAESLAALRAGTAQGRRLVLQVPDSAVSDTPYYRAFCDRMRELEIEIAHADFAAGPQQFLQHSALAPDYLKLARPALRAMVRNRDRQRQVQSLVDAAAELGCQVIVPGIEAKEEWELCRSLGIELGQGRGIGQPPSAVPLNLAAGSAAGSLMMH